MSNKNERLKFQPKGGMCFTCARSAEDCSGMKFDEMPIISTTTDGICVVKCLNYERAKCQPALTECPMCGNAFRKCEE